MRDRQSYKEKLAEIRSEFSLLKDSKRHDITLDRLKQLTSSTIQRATSNLNVVYELVLGEIKEKTKASNLDYPEKLDDILKDQAQCFSFVKTSLDERFDKDRTMRDNDFFRLMCVILIHMNSFQTKLTSEQDETLKDLIEKYREFKRKFASVSTGFGKVMQENPILIELFQCHVEEVRGRSDDFPGYLRQLNEFLGDHKLDLSISRERVEDFRGEPQPVAAVLQESETSVDLNSLDFKSLDKDQWKAVVRALIHNQDISGLKRNELIKYYKEKILGALREDERLRKELNKASGGSGKAIFYYNKAGKQTNFSSGMALLEVLNTQKRTGKILDFGKTKSSQELFSIMQWSLHKPQEYAEMTTSLNVNKAMSVAKVFTAKTNLELNIRNIIEGAGLLPGLGTDTIARTLFPCLLRRLYESDLSFEEQIEKVLDFTNYKPFFDSEDDLTLFKKSFFLELLAMAKNPTSFSSFEKCIPLSVYLLATTDLSQMDKNIIKEFSHGVYKKQILYAIKNHYEDLKKHLGSQGSALNAIIDYHQWKPGVFNAKTKSREELDKFIERQPSSVSAALSRE